MGLTVGGMIASGFQPAVGGMVSVRNNNKASNTPRSAGKSKKATKRLNYNYRDISAQLMRANKSQSASVVATRARAKYAEVMRKAASGEYNQKEVACAIAHARKMVKCAKMKANNLKEEERLQDAHERETGQENMRHDMEARRRASRKQQDVKQEIHMKEMQKAAIEKQRRIEIMQRKQRHRANEQNEMLKADMKYLKECSDALKEGGGEGALAYAGVVAGSATLDLSTEAALQQELAMLEQQYGPSAVLAEQQALAEMSMQTPTGEAAMQGAFLEGVAADMASAVVDLAL